MNHAHPSSSSKTPFNSILTRFDIDIGDGHEEEGEEKRALECVLVDCFASLPGYATSSNFTPVLSRPLPIEPWMIAPAASSKGAGKAPSQDTVDQDIVLQASRELRRRWKHPRQWNDNDSVSIQSCPVSDQVEPVRWAELTRDDDDSHHIAGRLRINDSHEDSVFSVDVQSRREESARGVQVLHPKGSAFLLTDLLPKGREMPLGWTTLLDYVQTRGGVDLLIMDPPYPNHSAERLSGRSTRKRKHGEQVTDLVPKNSHDAYETVDLYDLWALKASVRELLRTGGTRRGTLVAVWVTHSPKAKKFVLDKLFPAWNVRFLQEVLWLKILASSPSPAMDTSTSEGDRGCEPIYEDGSGRKPYEILILGRFEGQDSSPPASIPLPFNGFAGKVRPKQGSSQRGNGETGAPGANDAASWTWTDPEDHRSMVIASVPVGHSTKPFVADALSRFMPHKTDGSTTANTIVELFARGVIEQRSPGSYIAVGNEAIKRNVVGFGVQDRRRCGKDELSDAA